MNSTTPVPDWLPSSVSALQSFLKDHPDAEQKVGETFDKALDKVHSNTVDIVASNLAEYFGPEIMELLGQPDLDDCLQEFSDAIPPESTTFLHSLAQSLDKFIPTALNAFLKSNPDAEHQVRQILDKSISKLDDTTWNNINESLKNYWGEQFTDYLLDIAQAPDQTARLQEIDDSSHPEMVNFLRKIISLYGRELTDAASTSNQLLNDWRTFYRDISYDYLNKRYHIRIRIVKYNGEEPFIEGGANSILELTTSMIQTLLFLPSADAFSQPQIDKFSEKAKDLIAFLQQLRLDAPSAQPESKTAA